MERNDIAMDSDEEADALRALKRICPDACILTKDDSDTDTASDDDEMPPVSTYRLFYLKNKLNTSYAI